ncbi:DoxX family protein [Gorillibacterium timonense]|uniref:DoxX family protein n=1 Tax=Gorillibacterium timonense TaxID=1689269 RepID=UPI00071D2CE8|nr:DoxX family protein [Gorillibacterium timonense]
MKMNIVTTIMRIVLGILFLAHGINKFQTGLGNVGQWFESIHVPSFMAYIVATIELVGGILLIAGLFTRIVSVVLIAVLAGAIFTAKLSAGLLGNGQGAGYELDLAFVLVAFYLAFADRSPLSLDHAIFGRRG